MSKAKKAATITETPAEALDVQDLQLVPGALEMSDKELRKHLDNHPDAPGFVPDETIEKIEVQPIKTAEAEGPLPETETETETEAEAEVQTEQKPPVSLAELYEDFFIRNTPSKGTVLMEGVRRDFYGRPEFNAEQAAKLELASRPSSTFENSFVQVWQFDGSFRSVSWGSLLDSSLLAHAAGTRLPDGDPGQAADRAYGAITHLATFVKTLPAAPVASVDKIVHESGLAAHRTLRYRQGSMPELFDFLAGKYAELVRLVKNYHYADTASRIRAADRAVWDRDVPTSASAA